jgi:hypothetical protein
MPRMCNDFGNRIPYDDYLRAFSHVGFSDIRAYWPEPGQRLDISRMDRRLTAAIAQIDIDETIIPGKEGGPPELLRRRTKLKLHNKVTALEKLALHPGLFEHGDKDTLADRVRKMTPQERLARFGILLRMLSSVSPRLPWASRFTLCCLAWDLWARFSPLYTRRYFPVRTATRHPSDAAISPWQR